ncbi:TetR/AcrR family transcriptional regulator [Rhodococcus coprophilus]|uniref:TetR family transcriptional regulator n=1 Tax=Rhodococcus coprophilus TaxID=38310 RepID=A0A2X4U7B1_9NOCA|nr:TetR-like C-terminal domain-containing protein [Rhodococcus coprophilus]MBM7458110.1 AcrR family transcriptional regulator [Rhodococcus coprophilus]SQI31138.1 TetR family transcriptional regulator [Rhodococcus coprophilus]
MARDNSRPVRRRTLTREKVIGAALGIVEDAGWEQLTMSTLSGSLGIAAASLYNHVRNLDDVRSAIQVRAMTDLGLHLREVAMGRSGIDGLRALIDAHRAWAVEHPRLYRALTAAPVDRDALVGAALDANVALRTMLSSCGVPEDESLEVAISMFAALHGFATLEGSGFLGSEPDLDQIYETVVRGVLASVPLGDARTGRNEPV